MRTLWICDCVIERSCERQSRSISMNPASSSSSSFFLSSFQIFLSDGRVDNIAVMALHGLGRSSFMIFRPSLLLLLLLVLLLLLSPSSSSLI